MPFELEVKIKGVEEWQPMGDWNDPKSLTTLILIWRGNPAIEDVTYRHFEWERKYTDYTEYKLAGNEEN